MNSSSFGSASWNRSADHPSQDDTDSAGESSGRTSTADSSTSGHVLKYGSLGGLIATLSMTVFRMPTRKSLPPTAEFWATYVGSGDSEEYPVIALLLHLAYGVVSGVLFALVSPGDDDSEVVAESKGALLGTGYGVALSVFGSRVILDRLLESDPDWDERLVFHISHVVYGLTLGTWVGSRFGKER